MPGRLQILPAIVLLCWSGLVPTAYAGDVEMVRVKAEWPDAARRLDAMFTPVRGSARLSKTKPGEGGAASKPRVTVRFAIDQGREKFERTSAATGRQAPSEKPNDVIAIVGDTAFRLSRESNMTDYEVRGVDLSKSDRQVYFTYLSMFGYFMYAHHGVYGRPMGRVFESPGFRINDARALDQDGKSLIQVDCEFGYGTDAPNDQVTLVLDPDAGWVVRSCRWHPGYELKSTVAFDVEYDSPRGGVPIPRVVRVETTDGRVTYCEFTDWEFVSTPLAEFQMAHYGLPDLIQAHRPRNMLPYWLAGIAVVLGVVGFVVRRLAQRGFRTVRA